MNWVIKGFLSLCTSTQERPSKGGTCTLWLCCNVTSFCWHRCHQTSRSKCCCHFLHEVICCCRFKGDVSNCGVIGPARLLLGIRVFILLVLSVTRPNLLGQIVRGTSNHVPCDVVSPKAVETLNTWKMLQIYFSLCVKYIVYFSFS